MLNKNDTRSMLLHDSPQSLVLKLSVPAIIGMVVVGLYNFMDGVYVGQMVGDNAMAAVSVSYPFTLANSGISTLIGIGSASILSRAIGKRDQSYYRFPADGHTGNTDRPHFPCTDLHKKKYSGLYNSHEDHVPAIPSD